MSDSDSPDRNATACHSPGGSSLLVSDSGSHSDDERTGNSGLYRCRSKPRAPGKRRRDSLMDLNLHRRTRPRTKPKADAAKPRGPPAIPLHDIDSRVVVPRWMMSGTVAGDNGMIVEDAAATRIHKSEATDGGTSTSTSSTSSVMPTPQGAPVVLGPRPADNPMDDVLQQLGLE